MSEDGLWYWGWGIANNCNGSNQNLEILLFKHILQRNKGDKCGLKAFNIAIPPPKALYYQAAISDFQPLLSLCWKKFVHK